MKNLIEKIKNLKAERSNATEEKIQKQLRKEIIQLRYELENAVINNVQETLNADIEQPELTEKQQAFYKDIRTFLKSWVAEKAPIYLNADRADRKNPSKEEIKITIKRIGEMMTASLDKKSFSGIVDEFYFIKNGNMCQPSDKYEYLRNDF